MKRRFAMAHGLEGTLHEGQTWILGFLKGLLKGFRVPKRFLKGFPKWGFFKGLPKGLLKGCALGVEGFWLHSFGVSGVSDCKVRFGA